MSKMEQIHSLMVEMCSILHTLYRQQGMSQAESAAAIDALFADIIAEGVLRGEKEFQAAAETPPEQ